MKRPWKRNRYMPSEIPLSHEDPFSLQVMTEMGDIEKYDSFDRAMEFAEKHGMTTEQALARYTRLRMEIDGE